MDELKEIIINKISIYTKLYEIAKELNQTDNEIYYAECVGKLYKIIDILNK